MKKQNNTKINRVRKMWYPWKRAWLLRPILVLSGSIITQLFLKYIVSGKYLFFIFSFSLKNLMWKKVLASLLVCLQVEIFILWRSLKSEAWKCSVVNKFLEFQGSIFCHVEHSGKSNSKHFLNARYVSELSDWKAFRYSCLHVRVSEIWGLVSLQCRGGKWKWLQL